MMSTAGTRRDSLTLGVLISGGGTTLANLIERIRDGQATVHRSLEGPGPAGQTH